MEPLKWLAEQPLEVPPFEHQLNYVSNHLELPYWGLLWEMGTGKSYALTLTAAYLHSLGKIQGVLMVSQNGVHTGWAEFKWMDHWVWEEPMILGWDSYKIHTKKYQRELEGLCDFDWNNRLRVFSTSFDAFTWRKKKGAKRATIPSKGWEAATQFIRACSGKVLMCLDESSMIKDPKSSRTKQLLKLRHLVSHRRVMTGTPMTENPFNVWAQAEFLQRGLSGFDDYYKFQQEYAYFEEVYYFKRAVNKVVGYRNLDQLRQNMTTWSTQHLKSECLDLPPKIPKLVTVPLHADQKKYYDQLKQQARLVINDTEITPEAAMKRMHMLLNILLGYVTDDKGNFFEVPSHRLTFLLNTLKDVRGSAIIWCSYTAARHQIAQAIRETFGETSVIEAGGETPPSERTIIEQGFLKKKFPYLVANPRVMGYYYELYIATAEIYYDQQPSLEVRIQSEDRVHRQGLSNPVTIIDMVSEGDLLDHKFRDALQAKVDIAERVIELAREWLR